MATRYRFYNANPSGNNTTDCFIRAISIGENKTWEEIYRDIVELAITESRAANDPYIIEKYLRRHGWKRNKRPVKQNHKFYTVKEFLEKSNFTDCAIIYAGNEHVSYISNGYVWDTFNCENTVFNSWWTVNDVDTEKNVAQALKNLIKE